MPFPTPLISVDRFRVSDLGLPLRVLACQPHSICAPRMKRHFSEKTYSWWCDSSNIGQQNSKWLAEHLEEMEKLVKEMLRLMEEEGDSFAKKAKMCYQRRPELVAHVEDFYRMHLTLAERYDNVTGELLRNTSNRSNSGDSDSFTTSSILSLESTTPEERTPRHKQNHAAAGFDVFLGSGGGSDDSRKGSEMSSLSLDLESESESAKEEDGRFEQDVSSNLHSDNGVVVNNPTQLRVEELEKELSSTRERLRASEVEIVRLNQELESRLRGFEFEFSEVGKELGLANEMIYAYEEDAVKLRKELGEAQAVNHQRNEELALIRDQITALESQNQQLCGEIQDLKSENLLKDSTIKTLKSEVETAHEKYLEEKQNLEKLGTCMESLTHQKSLLEDVISEHGCRIIELQSSLSSLTGGFAEVESQLKLEIVSFQSHLEASRREVEELNKTMDGLKLERDKIASNRDELHAMVASQNARVSSMEGETHRLQLENRRLVGESQEARGRVRELEEKVERQKVAIWEVAESKKEAIRQLCSSMDYYRVSCVDLQRILVRNDQPQTLLSSLIPCFSN